MLSNYFKNSKPIQNVFLFILFFTLFLSYSIAKIYINSSWIIIFFTIINFILLTGTVIIIKIMMNELNLSRSSNYFAILFIAFLCFFPGAMLNINLVIATFLSTFSMYRFLKIDFSKGSKLSIFDACLFLFTAVIFHFWVIVYSILIVFATFRNYKKNNNIFLVPLVAFLTVCVLFLFFSLLINPDWTKNVVKLSNISFNYNYFETIYTRLSISFYFSIAIIMLIIMVLQLVKKPLLVQTALKKVIFWFVLAILIYVFAPVKSNDILLFSCIPLIIITSNLIEYSKDKILKNIILITILFFGLLFFTLQTFFS